MSKKSSSERSVKRQTKQKVKEDQRKNLVDGEKVVIKHE